MKLTLKTLLKISKGEGYKGSETDPEAMKSFLIESGVDSISFNGETAEVKSIIVEPKAAKKLVVTADDADDAPATKSAEPSDIDAKINAAVERATKAFNLGGTDGKPVVDPNRITVTPAIKRYYEANPGRFFKSYETAQLFHDHILATGVHTPEGAKSANVQAAAKKFQQGGVWHKAYATTPEAAGGALIAEQYYPDIINNVVQYGVARKVARIIPMSTDRITRPVQTGIHTVSYPEENVAATPSTGVTYSRISLTPKMGTVIVQASRQVVDDASGSGIMMLDNVAQDIARAVAYVEDQMVYTGTGTIATANVVGIAGRFANIPIGSAAGATVGASSCSGHTMANVIAAIAKLPSYARNNRTAWHCTPEVADLVFRRLANAQGGVTYRETVEYGEVMMFMGRPVVLNNVMNSTDAAAANTIDFLYGDLSLGVDFGDRMSLEIDISDQVYWTSNGIGVKGTVRHDVNVHDIGSASRVGPIVALYQS